MHRIRSRVGALLAVVAVATPQAAVNLSLGPPILEAAPHVQAVPVSAGAQSGPSMAELVQRPIPVRSGIGTAHEPVTTRVPHAQRLYDQGLAYLHSYSWIEAARSFNEAIRLDRDLALAHLGLSYALGEIGDGAGARAASRRAAELAAPATPRERFRIDLRVRQLAAVDAPGNAAAAQEYRATLARIGKEFASDVELLLLAGHAQDPADGHGMSGGSASLTFYERARALAPEYFAVDHYMAHAYENLGQPAAALPFAQRFAAKAPAIPHAHHMYAHALRQVDRMREAIAEFEMADRLHQDAAQADRRADSLDWHYRHNLDLLATAYQYVGRMRQAEARLKQSFAMPASGRLGQDQDVHKRAWPLFLLARRRPADALVAARAMQSHASPLVRAAGHIMASRALQASGDMAAAAEEGNAALRQMRNGGPRGGTLRPDFEIAQGEFQLRQGNAAGGALLKAGLTKLTADHSPDVWIATVFELEAATRTAREAGQPALAAELAALLRQHAPQYAGTHYELGRLAEARGDAAAARAAYAAAVTAWRDADPDLAEAADARRRAAAGR